MPNFDDLFLTERDRRENTTFQPFDKDRWAAQKKQQRADLYDLLDEATKDAVSSPDRFAAYLDRLAKFPAYSAANVLLIGKQRPDALSVADFETWKARGTPVSKGENGIMILESAGSYQREDGTVGLRTNIKKIFDISQTSAVSRTAGSTPAESEKKPEHDLRTLLKAMMTESPVSMSIVEGLPEGESANYSHEDKTIYFRKGLEGEEIFRCMAKNVALARAEEKGTVRNPQFISFCAAYVICRRYSIPEDDFGFRGLSDPFAGAEPREIRETFDAIRTSALEICRGIDAAVSAADRSAAEKAAGNQITGSPERE